MVQADIHILLNQVEGPVNLGSVCRAMANTGFSRLRFSGPLDAGVGEARKFSVHALPILEQADKCADINELIDECDLVFGFSPRNPWLDGRALDLDQFHEQLHQGVGRGKTIGLLFGNEQIGLTNHDLALCDFRVALPTNEGYASMNLAQAVLIVLWEINRKQAGRLDRNEPDPEMADGREKAVLVDKIQHFLKEMDFLDPQYPDRLWREVCLMFKTRDWTRREMNLLMGIFSKGANRYAALSRKLDWKKERDEEHT
ncbi:RNA methyltransferase [Acanthopleuribacter pedis]|uniref:RNA methyltransferase n=1 Tax=Acanthopleuribacter pedis TaxID=442870 RepID=A0A8J7QNB6_9BACT|nr:RNA methyltransferase [Acanthopleuribacter pedis]MBO1321175.1 RNA methyltransferase [Acanthopleuribacter pedis]